MPNENLKKLHSAVSAQYELPSIEVFEADMQDEGKRKKFYEAVSAEYELPEYNTFIVDMGFGEKKNSVTTEPLSSGGAVGATDVQTAESETGLFAPLQVPKMFAEKTLKVKETPAPKGQYTLEREGQKANVNRDDIFSNLENEEFLKGVKSGEVKVDIQDDEALGNLLNEKLKFAETKPIQPKTEEQIAKEQEGKSAWKDLGKGVYNSIVDAFSGFAQFSTQYLNPLPFEASQDIKTAQKDIIRQKADELKLQTSQEYKDAELTDVFKGNPYSAAKIAAEAAADEQAKLMIKRAAEQALAASTTVNAISVILKEQMDEIANPIDFTTSLSTAGDEQARLAALRIAERPGITSTSTFDPASFRARDNQGLTVNVTVQGNVQTEVDLADAIRQRILLEQQSGRPIVLAGVI